MIRSHSVFYQGSTFGSRLATGHRVTVREKTQAGENLRLGTLCDLQGTCVIGDYVRFSQMLLNGGELDGKRAAYAPSIGVLGMKP